MLNRCISRQYSTTPSTQQCERYLFKKESLDTLVRPLYEDSDGLAKALGDEKYNCTVTPLECVHRKIGERWDRHEEAESRKRGGATSKKNSARGSRRGGNHGGRGGSGARGRGGKGTAEHEAECDISENIQEDGQHLPIDIMSAETGELAEKRPHVSAGVEGEPFDGDFPASDTSSFTGLNRRDFLLKKVIYPYYGKGCQQFIDLYFGDGADFRTTTEADDPPFDLAVSGVEDIRASALQLPIDAVYTSTELLTLFPSNTLAPISPEVTLMRTIESTLAHFKFKKLPGICEYFEAEAAE